MNELGELLRLDFEACLQGPPLVAALVAIGLVVGILTGLFGVGGSFLINPLLITLLGVPDTLVVGSSLSFTIGTAAAGTARHWRMRNVEPRAAILLIAGALVGVLMGGNMHVSLKNALGPQSFHPVFLSMFLALLLVTAWIVSRGARAGAGGKSLLQRMRFGPRVDLKTAGLAHVSLTGLLVVGLFIGLIKGLLGIGGGVLLMPLLLAVVGLPTRQAVGTSLGVVMVTSIAGTVLYGIAGEVNLALVMTLLVGSTVGVQIGAWVCARLQAHRIRKYFIGVVLLAAVLIAVDLIRALSHG